MQYVGSINSAKGKQPTPGQVCLFAFPAWKEKEILICYLATNFGFRGYRSNMSPDTSWFSSSVG